jgi:P2-related tail formation protein
MKTSRLLNLLIPLLFFSIAVRSQTVVGNQQLIDVPINSGGTAQYKALLHLPNDYSSTTENYPLLVFLHGKGESGSDPARIFNSAGAGGPAYFIARNSFPSSFTNPADGKVHKFIVVSPQNNTGWSTSGAQLRWILNHLVKTYRVNTSRIYLAAISAGGQGLVDYISKINVTPDYVPAAAVPMSAAISNPLAAWSTVIADQNIKLWGFGSVSQDVLGENTKKLCDAVNLLKPGTGRFTNYSGGHCCWNTYFNPNYKENIGGKSMNIYEWMLQYTSGAETPPTAPTPPPPPPVNAPPSAHAGVNQSYTLPTNTGALNASLSSDPDGTIVSYLWSRVSGPTTFTISNPNAANTSVTNLVQGTYVFKVRVTDNLGATAEASVSITINAAPQPKAPPVANAGADKNIVLPTNSVQLNGSGSSVNGPIVKYEWNTISGPSNAQQTAGKSYSKPGGKSYTRTADAQGYLYINDATNKFYKGGDTIFLSGNFKSAIFENLDGSPDNYIVITNKPGEKIIVGDSLWNGGAYAQGMVFRNAHFINVGGDRKENFNIVGSLSNATDAYGNVTRASYLNLAVSRLSDNFAIHDMSIRHGGTGLFCKTDIVSNNPATWFPNTTLYNFDIFNLDISGTHNEGMYIGHTAAYWNINTNAPLYPQPNSPEPDPTIYKRPVKLNNVNIHHNRLWNIGADGIQTAAIDGLEVAFNEVSNWATQRNVAHNGGILIGGRIVGLNVHDNYVHDSYGEMLQVYAEGGGPAIIKNNLFARNELDGVSMRGSKNLIVTFENNSIIQAGGAGLRINGFFGQSSPQIVNRNLIVNPKVSGGTINLNSYIYVENGASVTEGSSPNDNKKYTSISAAGISPSNFFQYNNTSYGFVNNYFGVSTPTSGHIIVSPNSASTLVTGLVEGTYTFRLTVTDSEGLSHSDDVVVVVSKAAPAPNQPPVANAGTNISITLPTNSAQLNGAASSDPDGTIASYAWTKKSGPTGGNIVSPNAANTQVTGLVQGTYTFELTVTDNNGASAKASVNVTVLAAPTPNQPPVANAGTNISITLPTNSAQLNGAASSDPDGTIASYAWTKKSGPTGGNIVSPNAATTQVTGLVQGTYTFELTVTDNNGATATASVNVTVLGAPNQLPVANAGNNISITLPTNSAQLNGAASSDPDGTIASYAWTKKSGPTGGNIVSPNAATTQVTGLIQGTYTFELTVTDNNGASAKASVNVTVLAAPNQPPVANAGTNISITLPTNSAQLNGAASSDPDGTIASYAWTKKSGPTGGNIVSPNAATTQVTGLIQGTYTFELTVTDNNGASAKASVNVTVLAAPNQPPVANAGTNISITLPTNSAQLNGAASSDPDGTIASYAWTKVSGGNAVLVAPTLAVCPVNGLEEGVYVFRLRVTDNQGAFAESTVQITVLPRPNVAPVAIAGDNQTIRLPLNTTTLDGSRSFDPDGRIVAYDWVRLSGPNPFTIVNSSTAKPTLPNLSAGVYVFELTVTDDRGARHSDRVTITVLGELNPAVAPTARIIAADTVMLPAGNFFLDGQTSQTGTTNNQLQYNWSMKSGPTQAVLINPSGGLTPVAGLEAGVYVFSLEVTNSAGLKNSVDKQVVVINSNTRTTSYFEAYPNPTENVLTLQYESEEQHERILVSIYDLNGRKLLNQEFTKNNYKQMIQISLSSLSTGMYLLDVRNDKKQIASRKILKK